MKGTRSYDVVLFGATGFTGALTAEYLAGKANGGLRWALAGRNPAKLNRLRGRLTQSNPACAQLDLLQADAGEPDSLQEIASSTRVVITTVGPYIKYGETLVAACAEAGTDYVDLTGEPEFVDLMWLRHHQRALETGARIVHACGFDSIPADLGAWFTVQQLPEGVPIRVQGFVQARGTFSGGTLHSAVIAFARARELIKVSRQRSRAEGQPAGRRIRMITPLVRHQGRLGGWAVPMPVLDQQIVLRSASALDRYGPDFSYGHNLLVKRLPTVVGLAGGAATVFTLSQLPPTRNWLLNRKQPGDGPTPEQRAKGWFKVRFIGEGGGRRVLTQVSGGDPGYGETAKILAESALCLAQDEGVHRGGQQTTAVAMGNMLIERLQRAGIAFSVLERS